MRSARQDLPGYLIERALLSTATKVSYVSHGRVNAAGALKAAMATPKPVAPATTHAWVERGGEVVVEAERANSRVARNGSSWINGTLLSGYTGPGYAACWEDRGAFYGTGYATRSPELQYKVNFSTTGVYTVWLRTWAPDGAGDSVHLGVNGKALAATDKISTGLHRYWAWTRSTMDGPTARILIDQPGVRTINVWCREDGFRFDKIVITKGPIPVGKGPAESSTISIPR